MAKVAAQVKSEISSWLTSMGTISLLSNVARGPLGCCLAQLTLFVLALALGAGQVSAEFFELIKTIGEAHSKQV